jgi:hypothetical protein
MRLQRNQATIRGIAVHTVGMLAISKLVTPDPARLLACKESYNQLPRDPYSVLNLVDNIIA